MGQSKRSGETVSPIVLLQTKGTVEILPAGDTKWKRATTNQIFRAGDYIRTHALSHATVRWSDASLKSYDQLTTVLIEGPPGGKGASGWELLVGKLFFFHRGKSANERFRTPAGTAAVRGTEFAVEVLTNGTTFVTVIDGEVELTNNAGGLILQNGQQGVVMIGQPPTRTAVIDTINVIQWCLYYPAVLHLDELPLDAATQQMLAESLAAYRSGDVLQALAKYPADREPASAGERVYRAAVLLSVGRVDMSQALIEPLIADATQPQAARFASALGQLVAAVKGRPWTNSEPFYLGSEWLAASYHRQSERDLEGALEAARWAVRRAPEFGFGWARVAELEFSFGRIGPALEALEYALQFTPRNAEAHALEGFLLGARNRIPQAIESFNRALIIDSALGNAWLGRGLCLIRQGHTADGLEDLQTAAAVEPQRALLRSYLGKGYATAGDRKKAATELLLAKQFDPNDPTPWLYTALLLGEENRVNAAVRQFERAKELNNNRLLVRSKLLVDQDSAVASVNQALHYRDAGLADWSVLEAGRAVAADYASYFAHLFLANSYDELRDPNRVNLRYETPAESEYLIANLLAPVGAGLLAQSVSQQEYSRLFERDRLGVSSSTEYLSRGAWTQRGAQYGTCRNSGYLFEGNYHTDPGERPNGDFEETELRLHLKHQITPQDSIYFRAIHYEAEGGDTRQYYDPRQASTTLRTREEQSPILHAGYHHEWNPGVHTLLLVGRVEDDYSLYNRLHPTFFLNRLPGRPPGQFELMYAKLRYEAEVEIYSAEFQQIWKQGDHNTVVGARVQSGELRASNLQSDQSGIGDIDGYFKPGMPIARQSLHGDFTRLGAYAYHDWRMHPAFLVVAGVAYDRVSYPANYLAPPLSGQEEEAGQLSPKAGLVWTPGRATTVRLAYSRALSGASSEQSYALEPTQVAGFNQSFRSIVPESVGGSEAGVRQEMFGAALEQKFGSNTFIGLSGQILDSSVRRTLGVFRYDRSSFYAQPSSTRNEQDYREESLVLSLHQLVQEDWSLGVSYRLTHATLEEDFLEVPASTFTLGVEPKSEVDAILHQVLLQADYQHPAGFFWQGQALWSRQENGGYAPGRPGDDFWQFNVFVGYRHPGRRVELRLGLLNLTDQDYRLNPLTLYRELPHGRTLSARFQFHF